MDKILALLDGSIYSESVCHFTGWVAAKLDADVEAMHVLGRSGDIGTKDLSGALRLGARSALLKELSDLDEKRAKLAKAKGHAILEDAKDIFARDKVTKVTLRLRKGDLLQAINEIESDIRIIVVGKRGEGADFASGHLGSNLERIVRSSKVPILIASRKFNPVSKALVAYDGSKSAKVAIQRLAVSPVCKDLDICIVTVGDNQEAALKTAREAETKLRSENIRTSIQVASGETEIVLSDLIAKDGYDMLIMGAYGHSRIRSLIIGSTTTAMVQSVKIPVLIYR